MSYITNTKKLSLHNACKLLAYNNKPIQCKTAKQQQIFVEVTVWVEGPFVPVKNVYVSGSSLPFISDEPTELYTDDFSGLQKACEYCYGFIHAQHAQLADANDYI